MELFKTEYNISSEFDYNSRIIIKEGDCFEECKKLPDNFFSLIISSPPYNIGKSYEIKTTLENYIDNQIILIKDLYRICKDNGSIVWQIGNFVSNGEIYPLDIYFYKIFKELGMKLRNRIIWHFNHGLHASKRLSGRYETLLWFTKSDNYIFNLDPIRVPSKYPGKRYYKGSKKGLLSGNKLGKNPSDFWDFIKYEFDNGVIDIPNVKANHPEKTIHPCQFPIELVERFVLALTNENDIILDPFGGVGSSLIAGIKHDRRAMIIEKELQYVKIAIDKVNDYFIGKLKTREIGTRIYEPTGKDKTSQYPEEWFKQLNK